MSRDPGVSYTYLLTNIFGIFVNDYFFSNTKIVVLKSYHVNFYCYHKFVSKIKLPHRT